MPAIVVALATAAAWAGDGDSTSPGSAVPEEPAYKVLFENGFYAQVLEYLEHKVAQTDDTLWEEYQKYRAFSLILLEQRDSALAVFGAILDRNATFSLDPIYTSPKIYEVYHEARRAWDAVHAPAESTSVDSARAAARRDSAGSGDAMAARKRGLPPDWYRVPLYFVPGGTGQFYNRQPAKGAVLLIVQAVALAASVLTYAKRQDYYHPDYGWYAGNADEYAQATTAYRVEFGIFAAGYLWSVVDAFVVDGRRARARREGR